MSEGTLAVPKDVEEFRTMSAYGFLKLFTYEDLRLATGDFNPGQIVGEGGFGVVYRGFIDDAVCKGVAPTEVAVKELNPEGLQGDREWLVSRSSSVFLLFFLFFFFACIFFNLGHADGG